MEKNPKQYKCGLIMPIAAIDNCTAAHWDAVMQIIKEALEETEYEVALVSDSNEIGIIQKRIVQNIFSNDMVICDVSAKNPNVMFELGMRLAFDKPVLIIKDDFTNYSFDTGVIEHLNYPRDLNYHAIQQFKALLKTKLIATHKGISQPGYSSFLTSFSTVTASKLPEKEVGGMDYLLETMSEMRDDIRNLSKARLVSVKIPRVSMSGPRHAPLPPHQEFILYIMNEKGELPVFESISDHNFIKSCSDFYAERYPHVITSEAGHEQFKEQAFDKYKEYLK